jgi:hypothetical protein
MERAVVMVVTGSASTISVKVTEEEEVGLFKVMNQMAGAACRSRHKAVTKEGGTRAMGNGYG